MATKASYPEIKNENLMQQSEPNRVARSQPNTINTQKPSRNQSNDPQMQSSIIPGVQNMQFSTMIKKAQTRNMTQSSINPKTADMFKSYVSKEVSKSIAAEAQQLRQSLLLDLANTSLSINKIGKKMKKLVHREGTLESQNLFSLSQVKKNRKKDYVVPMEFLPQTRAEYEATKRGLPWPSDNAKYGKTNFRILYRRAKPAESGAAAKEPKEEFDTYFAFSNEAEFIKVRNYLFLLRLLDGKNNLVSKPIPQILQALSNSVKLQLIAKIREQIRKRAITIQQHTEMKKKNALENSRVAKNFDNYMRHLLISTAHEKAKKVYEKTQHDNAIQKRKRELVQALENSSILFFYDKSLVNRLLSDWQNLSEKLKRPDSQRIQIIFKSIEIPYTIIKPTFKIVVLIERNGAFKGALNINDELLYNESKELQAMPIIKKKIDSKTIAWRLTQKSLTHDEFVNSDRELLDFNKPYVITLDSIAEANIEYVRFKFVVTDENDKLQALYYAKLEHLFKSSKRGMDISLNLGTSPEGQGHLLNLGVISQSADLHHHNPTHRSKFLTQDYLQDIHFNYSFKFPHITPRHHKFISLLPESWRAMDEELKNNHRSGDLGKWVQRVKYKLARHYHRNSARHIANLEQTNVLWANLQEELARYSLTKPTNSEDIFIDEGSLQKMIEQYQPRRFDSPAGSFVMKDKPANLNQGEEMMSNEYGQLEPAEAKIVSYLFKRDRWESNPNWRPYYDKLKEICEKGVPPQLRKIIWSELSRVCYFIELTEMFLAQAELQQKYEAFDPGQKLEAVAGRTTRSRLVYEKLKWQALKEFYYLYQELEEDIDTLREKQGKEKLDYETSLRNICKTFIYWSHLFANIQIEEVKYYVSYSRAIVTLCQSLIVALSSSYLQSEIYVEEDTVFWLLISLTTYILASYYETNEEALSVEVVASGDSRLKGRKNNKITLSALRCPEIKGIKGDLLLLKLLLRELEPDIFYKFEELGLPLEEFFADHMLTLFSTLLSPGLTYRIWDLIFLEGSASNQVRSHRTAVITVFTILRNCKEMILAAKTYKEVNYDEFLTKVQNNITEYLEQLIPDSETFVQKLQFIKFAVFSGKLGKFDSTIRDIEQRIYQYHSVINERNNVIFGLTCTRHRWPEDTENENLSYATLSEMIGKFIALFSDTKSTPTPFQQSGSGARKLLGAEKLIFKAIDKAAESSLSPSKDKNVFSDSILSRQSVQKPKIYAISIVVHRVNFFWLDFDSLSLRITYDRDKFEKPKIKSFDVDFAAEFELSETPSRKILIEIYDNKVPNDPKKIKWVDIDLKAIEFGVPSKMILKFNEDPSETNTLNFTTSEVELSVLVTGMNVAGNNVKEISQESKEFIIVELENADYHSLAKVKLDSILDRQMVEQDDVTDFIKQSHRFVKTKNTWKENFAMSFENFLEVMKLIAPFWVGVVDWGKVYNSIKRGSSDQVFYINDFFTLLVLFGKFSFREKMNLLFSLHSFCNDTFKHRREDEINLTTVKGLARDIYQAFMIYLPYNEIDNMIDNLVSGSSSVVLSAVVNPDSEKRVNLPVSCFNRIANYLHLHNFTKDIYVADREVLQYIKRVYYAEVGKLKGDYTLTERNRLEINYLNDGLRHKFKIEFNSQWQYLPELKPSLLANIKPTMRLLLNNRTSLAMNHHDRVLNVHEFVKVFDFLPLIDYLCGFECIKAPQPINQKTEINFSVLIDDDLCFTIRTIPIWMQEDLKEEVIRSSVMMQGTKPDNKAMKFTSVLREWNNLVYEKHSMAGESQIQISKASSGGRQKPAANYDVMTISKTHAKVSIYFPIRKLVSQIKRYMIKDLYRKMSARSSNLQNPHPKLLNENLYYLDYEVEVIVNKSRSKIISNHDLSVYDSLYLIEGAFEEKQVSSIEARINLNSSRANQQKVKEYYNQLALYRFADASTEWLPCRLLAKCVKESQRFDRGTQNQSFDDVEGFLVSFEDFPHDKIFKHKNEVALVHDVNILELNTVKLGDDRKKQKQLRKSEFNDSRMEQESYRDPLNPLELEIQILNELGVEEEDEHRKETALVRKPESVLKRNY